MCEAIVGMKVILLDVVLVVKRGLGHWTFFVYGHRYFAIAAPSRRNYFHSASFLYISYALMPIAQKSVTNL
jgi:hypothetical protein